jgi:uncharacterized protein (TIGR03083 family)
MDMTDQTEEHITIDLTDQAEEYTLESASYRDLIAGAYEAVGRVVANLEDDDFFKETRCQGWVIGDLLFHMMLDAQRALRGFATPVSGPADVDFVTYWKAEAEKDEWSQSHARFVRISSSAYTSPEALSTHWEDTASAAVRAAQAASAGGYISSQGYVLSVPDFVATLVVEAAIHHLDLIVELPDEAPPDSVSLSLVRQTLDGLLGEPVPTEWNDVMYALKGTGRVPLTDSELTALDHLADRFPLIS